MTDVHDDDHDDDTGPDAPVNRRDSRLLVTGALVVLLAAVVVAAIGRALF
jgi:hypothetical protein